jgi:hypothetical protein
MRLKSVLGRRVLGLALAAFMLFGTNVQAATTFIVPQGGTGRTSFTANAILKGNGTGAITASGVSINSSNDISGARNLSITGVCTGCSEKYTVGPTGSGAKYITDGTADQVQINQAETDANAAGGGVVDIFPGTYNASGNILPKSNVETIGSGYDTRINLTTASIKVDTQTNVLLSHFRVDGTTNTFSPDSISIHIINSSDVRVDMVSATNSYGFAIFMTSSGTSTTQRITVTNSYFYSIGNQDTMGGGPANSSGAVVKDIIIKNNYIVKDISTVTTDKNAWDMVAVQNLVVEGNIFYGHVDSGFEQDAPKQVTFSDNIVNLPIGATSSDYAELAVDTLGTLSDPQPTNVLISNNQVTAGRIRVNGKANTLSLRVNIIGNIVNTAGSSASNQSGIMVDYAFYVLIDANNVTGNGSNDGIQLGSVGNSGATIVTNNIIHAFSNGINDQNANTTNTISNNQIFNCTTSIAGTPLGSVVNNIGANPITRYAQGNVTGATTFNRANGSQITATLIGNITVTLTAGIAVGDTLNLALTQDGTGSRTITWPGNFKKAGGTLTASTSAGAVDDIYMTWDGSNWREVSRSLNQEGSVFYVGMGALTGSTAASGSTTIHSTSNATKGEVFINGTDLSPSSNNLGSLGTSSLGWSGLFVASGGAINFNAGDITITHSSNLLTFAGAASGYSFDAGVTSTLANGDVFNARSGNSSNYTNITLGRSSLESRIIVPASAGQFSNQAGAGDLVIRNENSGKQIIFQVGSTDAGVIINGSNSLIVNQPTVGTEVSRLQSIATNDDPRDSVYQDRVATTDATVTTLHTFAIPSTTTFELECAVTARRTGGSSGTAEDGAGYKITGTYKNVSGTATLIGALSAGYTAEDQAAWDATLTPSSGNVLLKVTGAANNNVTWHATCHAWSLST